MAVLMVNRAAKRLTIILMCCWMNASLFVHAENAPPSDYQVKAVFLFNFAKFVEWPETAFPDRQAPLILGILGDNPFGNAFDSIKGKMVNGRKLLINRFKDIYDIQVCHILFVSSSEKERLQFIIETLKGSGILLVSDIDNFARQGGMVNFITKENKIRFEINVDAAQHAGLKISSKLLSLSTIIGNKFFVKKN